MSLFSMSVIFGVHNVIKREPVQTEPYESERRGIQLLLSYDLECKEKRCWYRVDRGRLNLLGLRSVIVKIYEGPFTGSFFMV